MSIEPPFPDRMAEVSRLCTRLADRALDAQIMGRPVPPEQVAALAKAARLLQDHGVEWPPLLAQVIHDLANDITASEPSPQAYKGLGDPVRGGLSRIFARLRAESEEP